MFEEGIMNSPGRGAFLVLHAYADRAGGPFLILINLMALRANLIHLIGGLDLGESRFPNRNQVNQPGD